jgi:hypothetical protein
MGASPGDANDATKFFRSARALLRVGLVDGVALAVVVLALASPAAAPYGLALGEPTLYTSAWSLRPIAGLNVIEFLFGALVLLRLLRPAGRTWAQSALDGHLLAFAAVVLAWQLVALLRTPEGLLFQHLDIERIGLVFAGYLVVTRMRFGRAQLRALIGLCGIGLVLAVVYLVVRYGLLESTGFGTSTGRVALLITEDCALVGLPVLLLWGLWVDRLLPDRYRYAPLALAGAVVVIDFASARRGALIFIALVILLRGIGRARRVNSWVLAAMAGALLVAFAASPQGSLSKQVSYVLRSTVLQTDDASSQERSAELGNFSRNSSRVSDLVLGHGLGAQWTAYLAGPTSLASYGGGTPRLTDQKLGPFTISVNATETPTRRIGWHIYGLDWLYKLGMLGVLALLGLAVSLAARVRRALAAVDDAWLRSYGTSLALFAPVLVFFAWTNLRVAFMAGLTIGLLSKIMDARPREP